MSFKETVHLCNGPTTLSCESTTGGCDFGPERRNSSLIRNNAGTEDIADCGKRVSMELRHLRYFVAVAEELHVTRAAARLHIAQQALSTQIRNLEMELGFDLLVRGSKGVTLTAAGRSFLEGAKKTLEAAVSSVELARSVAEREANVLRIGFCSYAMKLGLGDAIASFRAHYPEVQIVLDDLPASEQLLRIERGRLDVAICSIPL